MVSAHGECVVLDSTHHGHALRISAGPVTVEAWYERPPQPWKRFDGEVHVSVSNHGGGA